MKIISLTVENFKRLQAVFIKPDGTLAFITGKNAQGKSSVLDAIWSALGGAAAAPAKPIRKGADKAVVTLDLGELKVTRKWIGDRSTLTVESPEGATFRSPQAVLDKLVGKLSFDPLGFSRMDPKPQAETLRQLVGVDTSAQEAKRKQLFDLRTSVHRDLKELEAQLAGIPEVESPDQEISVAELARRQEQALAEQNAAEGKARAATAANERRLRAAELVEQRAAAVEKAEVDLEAAKLSLRVEVDNVATLDAEVKAIDVDALTAKVAEVRKAIGEADATNQRVRAKKARAAKAAEVEKKLGAAEELSGKIGALDEQIGKALQEASFPVPGLSFDGDSVTFNGVPFEQASTAEQIRIGLAIGAALNPKLRLVLVRDGSLLDKDALALVHRFAEEHDLQILMERVGDDAGPCGVVIEDGMVKGAAHCDGDHAAPSCSDPHCWRADSSGQLDLGAAQ